ncbi:MAG: N-formylglutamate amidohydrolase [Mesorhizobium sp.]
MHILPGVLTREDPSDNPVPLIFDVPRSGCHYPNDFSPVAPFRAIHEWVSKHVDDLYGLAPQHGATLLVASFANAYIDANRSLSDIDPDLIDGVWPEPLEPSDKSARLGIGLIHKVCAGDIPLYDRKLSIAEVQHRIENYYKPYHSELGALIQRGLDQHGAAWHLSCHCMATIGPDYAHDKGKRRADFCISDRDGTTSNAEFLDVVVNAFRELGYSVSVNDPFKGADSIRRHGNPAGGVNSLQIEMVKGLYMQDDNFNKSADYDRVREDLGKFAATVSAYVRSKI